MFKKYKKKILRVAVAITSVVVLFAMAAMPASAASSGWTSAVFNSYNEYLSYWGNLNALQGYKSANGTGMEWILPGTGKWVGNNIEFFVRANMDVSVKTGDRFVIDEKTIYGWFGGTENIIIGVRYFLGYFEYDDDGNPMVIGVVRAGSYTNYYFQGGASYGLTIKGEEFHITNDYDHVWVGIQFVVTRAEGYSTVFSINNFNYHYGFGNPNSPESPLYGNFDSNYINNLGNYEEQALNDSKGGLTAFGNSISTMQGVMRTYMAPMVAVTDMLNIYLGIRSLDDMVNLSLTFGVIAFLLSSSLVAYVARSSRSDNSVKAKHGKSGGKNG